MGKYASFNINNYCGDDAKAIAQNRQLLCARLGIGDCQLVFPHQTHGTEICAVTPEVLALSAEERSLLLEGVDAVMTDVPGICIGVSTADCIPVLLSDPVHRVVAAVHAGWRGTVARIVQKTIARMQGEYGTRPTDLHAVIGPGISLEHFEVGNEVYEAFALAGFDMARIARRYDKWHLDLPACNHLQMTDCGVQAAHIHLSGICTFAQADEYFSARRLGIASGRIFSGIQIL